MPDRKTKLTISYKGHGNFGKFKANSEYHSDDVRGKIEGIYRELHGTMMRLVDAHPEKEISGNLEIIIKPLKTKPE